jgi:RND family efflux transporter MFP subunit
MKRSVVIIIIIGIVILLVAAGARQVIRSRAELAKSITELQEEIGIPVEVAEVELGTFRLTHLYLGTVEGTQQSDVMANIAEEVVEIPVKVGDRVRQGQVICRLDTKASMAQYNQLKLAHKDAKLDAERMENLYKSGAVSKQMMEKALLARDVAKENLESSSQVVALTAPFSGIITELFYRTGETTQMGEPVVRIANLNKVKIKFSANHEDWKRIKRDTPVMITVNGNGQVDMPAEIDDISISADPKSRLFSIWVEAENSKELLQPGLLVDVQVAVIQKPDAILIPRDAVIVRDEVMGVFIVSADGHAAYAPFTAGHANAEVIEVTEGLEPGQTLVVYGHNNLEDGQLVNIVNS